MEVLKLSKFKLQLRALIADVHELKERERSTNEQLSILLQKQKQSEEEFTRRIHLLETEICGLLETKQKVQRKVNYLQNDNALLESKQKDLKEAIENLLQSRESFLDAYQESTTEMKNSIEVRDRKIAMLAEKISSHLVLFDLIQKEALCVKRVVDKVETTLAEKEKTGMQLYRYCFLMNFPALVNDSPIFEVLPPITVYYFAVDELKRKMQKVASFEELFQEKISVLESKSRDQGKYLQAKNKIIMELEAQLDVAKTRKSYNSDIEELQNAVSAKEIVIENLMHEKKALQLEVRSLSCMLKKIQDTYITMQDQGGGICDSQLENQEGCATSRLFDNNRMDHCLTEAKDSAHQKKRSLSFKLYGGGSTEQIQCQENDSASSPLKKNKYLSNCLSESACSACQTPSEVPCATNDSEKVVVGLQVVVMDSESSTTQTENLRKQDN